MRPENLDKWIEHLRAQPSDDLDRRIDALLDSQPKAESTGGCKRTPRSWTARLAIAAVVTLAVLIGIPLFNGDRGSVWARAIENARKVSNYTFHLTRIQKSSDSGQSGEIVQTDDTWYVSAQQGLYIESHAVGEHDFSSVFYELPDSNEWIKVYPAAQEYERGPSASSLGFEMPQELPKEAVLSLLGSDYVELGTKSIDGRVLMGVRNSRIPDGASEDVAQWNNELWFDNKTMLLASREQSVLYKGSGTWHVTRQDRFQYNTGFPSHVSAREIPEGYAPTIVNGLRLFSQLSDGTYPARSLDLSSLHQKFGDRAGVERAIERLSTPVAKYGYDSLTRAASFFRGVVQASPEFAYYGDRVTARDAHRVLIYWGDPQRFCQVLWGDLRVETLSKDQLIRSCRDAGDRECLLDLVEKDDGTRIPALAACLSDMGDLSIVPALLRNADLRQGSSAADSLAKAIDVIRQREEQRNPGTTLVMGRLLYASTRPASGSVQIGRAQGSADRNGYFALMVPCRDPDDELVGYAKGRTERLFLWTKKDQPSRLTIVLEWTSRICARVLGRDGTPRSNADVGLTARLGQDAGKDWPDGIRAKTDAQGRLSFESVPVGLPLELVVENANVLAGSRRVQVHDLASDRRCDLGDIVID